MQTCSKGARGLLVQL